MDSRKEVKSAPGITAEASAQLEATSALAKFAREHVATASGDIVDSQLGKLQRLFPEVFVEGKVDFDKLRATLGAAAESGPGRFHFSWAGKDDAVGVLQTPSCGTLIPSPETSVNFDETQNVFIEGDNLEVLKLLFKPYFGRVNLIYIDPPYNTGQDFVYPDNYTDPLKNYLELTGQSDAEGNLLTSNPETSGRYHSSWLSMMYPRLFLARQLLDNEGIICVSIDDFEAHHLRLLMNEIFGEENFIAQLVWEKGRKNDAKLFSVGHEYIVIYALSKAALREKQTIWREAKPGAQEIWEEYLRLREKYANNDGEIESELSRWYQSLPKGNPSKALSRYKHIDEYGPWRDRDISWPGGGGPRYDVLHPKTHKPCKVPEAGWRFSTPEAMQRKIDLKLVEFRDDHTEPPFLKARLKPRYEELEDDSEQAVADNVEPDTEEEQDVGLQVMGSYLYKQSQVAVKYLKGLMGAKVFDNPKDHEVLARLFRYCSADNALILDFFAGSGSTAEAVLRLNHANKGSRRRFILVQLPEPTRRRKSNGKYSETIAYKKGFKNIAELGEERIRRVIGKLKEDEAGKLDFVDDGKKEDLAFKVFKLERPNIQQWKDEEEQGPEAYAEKLALFNDPLAQGWKPENVIWEVALREGFSLNTTFKTRDLANGNKVYDVVDPDTGQKFIACLDDQIPADFSKSCDLTATTFLICRDVALDDSAAANLALQCRLKTI
jgi:adenine-specific DNA-methyltransferase